MKNIFFLLLIISSFNFYGCENNKPKELIVNKWRITNIETPEMPLDDATKEKAMKGTMEFTKDGIWIISGMDNDNRSGTYTLSDDGKSIFVMADGKTEILEIIELTESKLVWLDKQNNSKVTVVPR